MSFVRSKKLNIVICLVVIISILLTSFTSSYAAAGAFAALPAVFQAAVAVLTGVGVSLAGNDIYNAAVSFVSYLKNINFDWASVVAAFVSSGKVPLTAALLSVITSFYNTFVSGTTLTSSSVISGEAASSSASVKLTPFLNSLSSRLLLEVPVSSFVASFTNVNMSTGTRYYPISYNGFEADLRFVRDSSNNLSFTVYNKAHNTQLTSAIYFYSNQWSSGMFNDSSYGNNLTIFTWESDGESLFSLAWYVNGAADYRNFNWSDMLNPADYSLNGETDLAVYPTTYTVNPHYAPNTIAAGSSVSLPTSTSQTAADVLTAPGQNLDNIDTNVGLIHTVLNGISSAVNSIFTTVSNGFNSVIQAIQGATFDIPFELSDFFRFLSGYDLIEGFLEKFIPHDYAVFGFIVFECTLFIWLVRFCIGLIA